jgi:putative DNA methylase
MTISTALETDFPIVEVSQVAEQESWRKEINRPIYHIHKWWATRLGSVFRAIALGALRPASSNTWDDFYKKHDLSNKVVLDPFMGSGTTLGEAVKLGAKAIGCDINPVSSFLVRQAFTRVSERRLRAAFGHLENSVAPEIKRYYRTRDPQTGEFIQVLYYFWVKIVTTPGGDVLPLFSRYVFAQDAYPKKKPRAQLVCAGCWVVFEGRYDIHKVECPECAHQFNPQVGPAAGQFVIDRAGGKHRIKELLSVESPLEHKLYAIMALRPDGTKVYLTPTQEDSALYDEAVTRLVCENLPLPTMEVRPGHNTDQARGYNYKRWRDFFNPRQLLCHGLLLRAILAIEDIEVQEQMLCLFSSTLEFNNLFCSFKGEGTGAVRHMFSNHILKPERTPLENSVWGTHSSSGTFSTLFESRLLRAKRYLDEPFELVLNRDLFGDRTGTSKVIASRPINVQTVSSWDQFHACNQAVMILNGDSSQLPVPDESIDAVITDPPYFDFVHYSELSDFFFAWLSPALRSRHPGFARPDSSDTGEVQHKDSREFARLLGSVFGECRRVLKKDGVLAFSFHHSRPEGWAAIYEAINTAGLCVVAAHPVHAELRGASPKTAAKAPISLDAILVCKRRADVPTTGHVDWPVVENTVALATRLESAGMLVSDGDRFVIGASQTLIPLAKEDLSFEDVEAQLAIVWARFFGPTRDTSGVERDVDSTASQLEKRTPRLHAEVT